MAPREYHKQRSLHLGQKLVFDQDPNVIDRELKARYPAPGGHRSPATTPRGDAARHVALQHQEAEAAKKNDITIELTLT